MSKLLNRKQLEDAAKCDDITCDKCSLVKFYCHGGNKLSIDIAQTALTTIDMLKKLEWSMVDMDDCVSCCPVCGGYKVNGHVEFCALGNLLMEVDGK
jgi:riboflavin synthase alpha subunit